MENLYGCVRYAETKETWEDVGDHGFWRRGTTSIFYIGIVNLDAGSNLCMTPEKALAEADNDKKDKHLHTYLDHSHYLTPLAFSADLIPVAEAWNTTAIIASHLRSKLKREYSNMRIFVPSRMALTTVRPNNILLQGIR